MTYLPFPPQDEEQVWASQAAYTGYKSQGTPGNPHSWTI